MPDRTGQSLYEGRRRSLVDRAFRLSTENENENEKISLFSKRQKGPASRTFFGASLSNLDPAFCNSTVVRGSGFLPASYLRLLEADRVFLLHTISW